MEHKICLITGANSEIAKAIAEQFESDYHLILCWHQNNERITELLKKDNVTSVQADLQHEKQVKTLIYDLFQQYNKIDLLINCIGKNSYVPDDEISEEIWDDIIAVNLKPAFFLCKYFLEYCNKINKGCIIHISSTAGIRPLPTSPHYITAKAGLIALSEYYAKIMAPNIRVNTIAPGFVQTQRHTSPSYDDIRKRIPMQRMADLSEIAQTVLYLAECQYITGQTIIVDGGLIS